MIWTRGLMAVAAAVLVLVAVTAAGCAGDPGSPQWRQVAAPVQKLNPPPGPDDQDIHVDVLMGALSDMPDPVAKVDVRQDDHRIEIRVWIHERVPAAGEQIPGSARSYNAVIHLASPVGNAEVVDVSVNPPRVVPRAR